MDISDDAPESTGAETLGTTVGAAVSFKGMGCSRASGTGDAVAAGTTVASPSVVLAADCSCRPRRLCREKWLTPCDASRLADVSENIAKNVERSARYALVDILLACFEKIGVGWSCRVKKTKVGKTSV